VLDEPKQEPRSKGITTPRKKKPKELAAITECCAGCAGSPACVEYCPLEDCLFWIPDVDHPPFGRIEVDPILCIGCKKRVSKGPHGVRAALVVSALATLVIGVYPEPFIHSVNWALGIAQSPHVAAMMR
jgi:ferredoxin